MNLLSTLLNGRKSGSGGGGFAKARLSSSQYSHTDLVLMEDLLSLLRASYEPSLCIDWSCLSKPRKKESQENFQVSKYGSIVRFMIRQVEGKKKKKKEKK